MAETNTKVMDRVAAELEKDPGMGLESLYARAKEVDPSIGELSLRQFHARYPLQVKRAKARAEGRGSKRSAQKKRGSKPAAESAPSTERRPRRSSQSAGSGQEIDREKVRALFLEFASDFAAAESRAEIVNVLGSVDSYVNRISKLAAR